MNPFKFKTPFKAIYSILIVTLSITTGCNRIDHVDNNNKKKLTQQSVPNLWVTKLDKSALLQQQKIPNPPLINPDETISINTSQTFQEMDGFGFALTEGSAMLINTMSPDARDNLLNELFGQKEDQIGISYLRIGIGASDMIEELYSYDDLPTGETDLELKKFSLSRDTLHLIPIIKKILVIAPDMKFVATPWSAPTWMKDSKDTQGGSLIKKYSTTYANYFVKYIKAMAAEGINITTMTVQNESLWDGNNPSMLMLAKDQAEFVKNHLGPAFQKNNIKTKILIYDHNPDRIDYPLSILKQPDVAKFVDGTAFHLYGGEISALSKVHNAHPEKNIYFTEQWTGYPTDFSDDMTWHIKNVIVGATQNWSKNVLLWNLAADENQGPHTDRGGCDDCLGAITIKGDEIQRNVGYYIIGHASKFVKAGAKRIASSRSESNVNTAFLNPNGEVVLIIQNTSNTPKKFKIEAMDNEIIVPLSSGSVGTVVFNNQ